MTERRAGQRPCALITGASAGLGAEFAKQYAARGYDLLLVARRRARLEVLAQTLAAQFGVTVAIECRDLAQPQALVQLVEGLDARALDLEVLVNNAGYGVPGSFLSHAWPTHADFQQVMVNAVAELCHRLAPRLVARGRGTIINVASLAGYMPGSAGHTLYGPAKAWLIKFSECLAAELKPQGVAVLALCPGFTYTEFHDVNGMRAQVARLPPWLWLRAETVVRDGLAAVARGEVCIVPGRVNRLLALGARLLPRAALRRLLASRERDFRRID